MRIAPFLRASSWVVERRHFAAQTIKAAQAWREVIAGLGAEVVAAEEWLAGTWSGIAVHGQTDLILALPGERLLVVDYKRSKFFEAARRRCRRGSTARRACIGRCSRVEDRRILRRRSWRRGSRPRPRWVSSITC